MLIGVASDSAAALSCSCDSAQEDQGLQAWEGVK